MPERVSTILSCSALCKRCASAAAEFACRAAASSACSWLLVAVSWLGSASLCGLEGRSVLLLGAGDNLAALPVNGVPAGPICTGGPSSPKILPIDDRGFWMDRNSPLIAAFSSLPPSPASVSYDEVDLLGVEDSPSTDFRRFVSDGPVAGFSGNGFVGVGEAAASSMRCFSAMADTAASTCFSKSSSDIVNVVRSRFSMNCTAPSY